MTIFGIMSLFFIIVVIAFMPWFVVSIFCAILLVPLTIVKYVLKVADKNQQGIYDIIDPRRHTFLKLCIAVSIYFIFPALQATLNWVYGLYVAAVLMYAQKTTQES